MDSHRSWFPVILTGLSIALAAMIFAVYQPGEETAEPMVAEMPAPTGDEYQAAIGDIFGPQATQSVQAKLEALTEMRVPAEYLTLHLQLVFVMNDYVAGNIEEGDARLNALRGTNSWLP